MKNFLVPVDFSEASQNAARYAISLGEVLKAKIIFINVVPIGLLIEDESLHSRIAAQAQLVESNKDFLSKEIIALSKNHSVSTEGYVAEGPVPEMILQMAHEHQSDLIIMGMKGKGKSSSIFGSNTTAVIKKANYSVLVIPESASYESIDTICYATDLNDNKESKDISILLKIAEKYNSTIQILHVQKQEGEISDEEFIQKMRVHSNFDGLQRSFHVVTDSDVINGINNYLESSPADVLAMTARKHSFLERLFGTVHTKKMSYETKIPLLVLKEG
ncbi:MAG TPA: universal stress protein [Hanamia sp.]|jgi:nucleotide-binding universal stress UspA family protein|nr:universal stress protein [Hanamia sp.]